EGKYALPFRGGQRDLETCFLVAAGGGHRPCARPMDPTPTPPLKGRGFPNTRSPRRRATHDQGPCPAARRLARSPPPTGAGRVAPPLAEFRETLGGDDERTTRDLLRFTDPVSQRTLALRPDITRQVGRIATSLLAKAPRPLRLCYAGQIAKLRASQLRPAREMLQVGAELIGSDSVAAAREIVTVAIDALEAAGIGPVTIDFTLPDVVDLLAGGPLPVEADIQHLRDELDAKDAGALT